jgi:hypothetical protein
VRLSVYIWIFIQTSSQKVLSLWCRFFFLFLLKDDRRYHFHLKFSARVFIFNRTSIHAISMIFRCLMVIFSYFWQEWFDVFMLHLNNHPYFLHKRFHIRNVCFSFFFFLQNVLIYRGYHFYLNFQCTIFIFSRTAIHAISIIFWISVVIFLYLFKGCYDLRHFPFMLNFS